MLSVLLVVILELLLICQSDLHDRHVSSVETIHSVTADQSTCVYSKQLPLTQLCTVEGKSIDQTRQEIGTSVCKYPDNIGMLASTEHAQIRLTLSTHDQAIID